MKKTIVKKLIFALFLTETFLTFSSLTAIAGVRITPSFILKHITKEDSSFSLQITHIGGKGKPLKIDVYPAGLRVELQGLPRSLESEEIKKKAAKLLSIEPDSFTLKPGESRIIKAKVKFPEKRKGGLYQTIVFEIEDLDIYFRGVKPTITRLTVPILLVLPGSCKLEGKVIKIEFRQKGAGRPILVGIHFLNTGNIHFNPTGRVDIFNSQGEKMANVPLQIHTVFPGYPRLLLAGWWAKDALPGKYEAVAHIKIGKKREIEHRESFSLVKKGTLAQVKASISEFTVDKRKEGEPVTFSFLFENEGDIPLSPRAIVEILDGKGERIANLTLETKEVLPGEKKKFQISLIEGLTGGDYKAILEVKYGEKGIKRVAKVEKNFFISSKKKRTGFLKISDFSVDFDQDKGTLSYSFRVENLSEKEVSLEGFLDLRDENNKTVGQAFIEKTLIFPGSTRKFEETWPKVLSAGLYGAKLNLIYAEGQLLSKETSFVVQK